MRTSNLIQSYISTHPASQQYQSDKAVREFDVHKELSNRTFIKPLPSNGKLIRTGVLDYPSQFRKDMIYNWNAFKHAAKGEANDHELGKLNDVGMKIGGLAIAAYLFTRKQTPMTKLFEFIGLGTFFAAMDLWPKLFIQLPAKLVHGVNVRQEYEDSFGRKKMFYQDHQFIPWDLYSEAEINKVGDRLGVPKDIPNRREFIQEKMRKIALQNNTLWMLTAGFATPLMSALMCNALESPVAKFLDQRATKQAENLLTNFQDEIAKVDFTESTKQLDSLLAEYAGKPITTDFVEALHANLTDGLDHMVAEGLSLDFDKMLPVENGKFNLSNEHIEGIQTSIRGLLEDSELSEAEIKSLIPTAEELSESLSSKGLLGGSYDDFSLHTKAVQDLLDSKISALAATDASGELGEYLDFLATKLVHAPGHGLDSPLMASFKVTPSVVLDDNLAKMLKSVSTELNSFKAKSYVLDKYAFMKAAQAPETSLANGWNEVQSILFKALKFTPEEVRKARLDGELASSVLRDKLETITADKATYEQFVDEIGKALNKLHERIQSLDMTQEAKHNTYKEKVEGVYDSIGATLKRFGLQHTAEQLVGYDGVSGLSSKSLALDFITDRVTGVKSSFYRFLNLADMFYKISHPESIHGILKDCPREVKEELVELAKVTMLEGHNSDFAVKFWQKRNPNPDMTDYSDLEVKLGKVINKYFGTHDSSEVVELANDRNYYKKVMRLLFGDNIHPDTMARISSSEHSFRTDFLEYRQRALNVFGNDKYFVRPNFLVDGHPVDASSWSKFLLMGSSPNEMFNKWANQSFNSGKWFNLFGKLGAGLIGVTLLAQFFFGRMKTPQPSQEVKA